MDTPPVAGPDDKETLVAMLRQASELEHALCVQYLYAAFTLKAPEDPGISASHAALARQWSRQIRRIAVQEMYHLMLASNMMTALGALPNLRQPGFPQPSTRYSDIDLPSLLAPFDLETAHRFMCWEKPDQSGWWDDFCEQCQARSAARVPLEAVEPPPYNSIGELYESIKRGFLEHPDWIDPATAARQVSSALVPFAPPVLPITTAEDAARYVEIIVTEGEGGGDWESDSHFAYFHQIVNQLEGIAADALAFSHPTVDSPVYEGSNAGPGAALVTDPGARAIGLLFNDLYELLVLILVRLFSPNGETPAERRSLANAALALMPLGIEPLGILLTRLPAGDAFPGLNAGPSFELPEVIDPRLASKEDALPLFREDLLDIVRRGRAIELDGSALSSSARRTVGVVAARLEALAPLLEPESRVGVTPR